MPYHAGASLAGKDSSDAISTMSRGSSIARPGDMNANTSNPTPPSPIPVSANVRLRDAAASKVAPAAAARSRRVGVKAKLCMFSPLGQIQAFQLARGITEVLHPDAYPV